MYDSVVVAVDGSAPADAAATQAVDVASTFGANVTILSVHESHTPSLDVGDGSEAETDREALDEQTRESLDDVESRALQAGVPYRTVVETGRPASVLSDVAADESADLISLGTSGRSGVEQHLLGSVAERVLRTSAVPVLATPALDEDAEYDDVVVPTDGSDCSQQAADHALALASRYGATVHAVSVVDIRSLGATYDAGPAVPTIVEEFRDLRRESVDELADRASERGVDVTTAVFEGLPHRAISDYVEDEAADLTVMGTHGRSGLRRAFLGSVAERTIRESPTPVLAVPEGE